MRAACRPASLRSATYAFTLCRVAAQEAQAYADENGLFFMETSAKTANNVNGAFTRTGVL